MDSTTKISLFYYKVYFSVILFLYIKYVCREAIDLWNIFSVAPIVSYLMLQLCFQTGVPGFGSHLFSLVAASRLSILLVKWKYRSILTYDGDGVISQ